MLLISTMLDALSREGLLGDERVVRSLRTWAESLVDETEHDIAVVELATRLAGERKLDAAEETARLVKSVHEYAQGLRQVAESELEVGEADRAVRLLREAIRATERIPPNWYWERAEARAYIAKALHHAGEHSAASEQWEIAINIAKAGEQADPNAVDCSAVLWTISKMLLEADERERAIQVASDIRDESRRQGAMEQFRNL